MKALQRPMLLLLLACAGARADETIPVYEGLGTYHRQTATAAELAQHYFDQGMMLSYAFGRPHAVKSFRACRDIDPDAAMCAWGEAWALGPYLNGRMKEKKGIEAYAAIRAARELIEAAAPVERALIGAMAKRYAEEPASVDQAEMDRAYADAMRAVAAEHPGDHDVQALFAEALMVLHPWDLYPGGEPRPEAREAIEVLEAVLDEDLRHAGACHLYIHAVEPSEDPGRGEACADLLAEQIPLGSHIQHMPSHIYMRIGRYGDAVRANQEAHLVDQMSDLRKAVAIYRGHNVRMMWFAAWMDGQSFVALEAARLVTRQRPDRAFDLPQTLARFGRWEELLEGRRLPKKGLPAAVWRFGRGLARLRTGDAEGAVRELRKLDKIRDRMDPAETFHPDGDDGPIHLARIARGILAGEIAADRGDHDGAERDLLAAMTVEDALEYSEPERWAIPVRQVLGAILLAADRPGRAQAVYEEELARHPENGWSLFGLSRSLRAQGREAEAEAVEGRFDRAWSRADVVLTSSRF